MVNTWKIILATVVIFGAGVITGGLLVGHTTRIKAKQQRALVNRLQQPTLPPQEFPRRQPQELQFSLEQRRIEFLRNATRELQLSPEQGERIERLLRESQERTGKLWEQVGPQIRQERAEIPERIREVLTPAQRKRFEELMKRQQARRIEEAGPGFREKREGRRLGPLPGDAEPGAGALPPAPAGAPTDPPGNP